MARFRRAAGSGAFSYLDRQLVFPAIRLVTRAGHEHELDALAYGVATGARFPAVNPDFRPWFRLAAIGTLTRTGNLARVDELLWRPSRSPDACVGDAVRCVLFKTGLAGDRAPPSAQPGDGCRRERRLDRGPARRQAARTATGFPHTRALLFAGRYAEAASVRASGGRPRRSRRRRCLGYEHRGIRALDALGRRGKPTRCSTSSPRSRPTRSVGGQFRHQPHVAAGWPGTLEKGSCASDLAREVAEKATVRSTPRC